MSQRAWKKPDKEAKTQSVQDFSSVLSSINMVLKASGT